MPLDRGESPRLDSPQTGLSARAGTPSWCYGGGVCDIRHNGGQGERYMAVSDAKVELIGELTDRLNDLRRFL